MRRLFLDANVLFTAAHNPSGKSAFLLELGSEGLFEIVSCGLAFVEAERNLAATFPDALVRFQALADRVQVVPTRGVGDCPIPLPPKDVPILLSAIGCRSTHLLTGDLRHFGPFMNRPEKTAGMVIQTVNDFLDGR